MDCINVAVTIIRRSAREFIDVPEARM